MITRSILFSLAPFSSLFLPARTKGLQSLRLHRRVRSSEPSGLGPFLGESEETVSAGEEHSTGASHFSTRQALIYRDARAVSGEQDAKYAAVS